MEKVQFLKKSCWDNWIPQAKGRSPTRTLYYIKKLTEMDKWIKDLNVRAKIFKLL